ncbi:MAG: ABC transporter ATP-binding protein [Gammaproteobacteria bacterium]|nr:ABC transporter ATP-binding protein [Gammaproteobacteria bacterium]
MTEIAIQIEKVVKTFGRHEVLKEINLTVQSGEFIGLVGINGAGKTTLIKCMLDFCNLTSGSIDVFGVQHTRTDARKRLVFLPEKFMPPYYLTGSNFLVYMSELHGVEYRDENVAEMMKILDLGQSALLKPVRQYSKGMGQKLGLAACLLSKKDLLLFDEPMSGLDPKARAYLKRHLLELKQAGKTLFFSTHLLSDVETLCDRVAILHAGRIHFIGTPQECCHKYQTSDLEQAYLACVGG